MKIGNQSGLAGHRHNRQHDHSFTSSLAIWKSTCWKRKSKVHRRNLDSHPWNRNWHILWSFLHGHHSHYNPTDNVARFSEVLLRLWMAESTSNQHTSSNHLRSNNCNINRHWNSSLDYLVLILLAINPALLFMIFI